jgi:tRNA (adenine57-N1/adenine58-N1)-methyltransferase
MKVLIDEKGRKFFCDKDELHTDLGVVKGIKKAKPGVLKSHKGSTFTVVEPSFEDIFDSMKRGPQVVRIEDAAYIAGKVGVCGGFKIVDAGAGSGALACFLAYLSGPKGHVYTYEKREEFAQIAESNAKKVGITNLTVKNRDISEGIDERNLDLITLDLAEPWKVFPHAAKLKIGRYLVCYVPTVEQMQKVVHEKPEGFIIDEVCEISKRKWITEKRTRPENVGLVYTAFLIFLRKLS